MTTDGGKTWTKTLYIDNQHGVADLDIDPTNPNILYAGMWSFERKPWTHRSGSEKGGVYKSIDGGRTWNKLTNGLPKLMGRIGVRVAPSNPNVVYAIVEAKDGTLYRSDDRGETFRNVSKQDSIVSRGFYYTTVRVDPTNENRVFAVASTLFVSVDGGKTFRSITSRSHIDFHALWIDPKNPKRMWHGQDGGIGVTYDGGESWEAVYNMPLGQFYQIHADNRQPFYYVMGGLAGQRFVDRPEPHARTRGHHERRLAHGQFRRWFLRHQSSGQSGDLSFRIAGRQHRLDRLSHARTAVSESVGTRQRWWTSSRTEVRLELERADRLFTAREDDGLFRRQRCLFKSPDFGKTWEQISPDLTTNDPEKLKDAGGPMAIENSTAEYHSTIITVAESPADKGQIWVGTDDGNLQMTTDGGKNWTNLVKNVSGMAANSPVSHVEPSRTNGNTAYVSFERHMFDDFRPYIFKTTDAARVVDQHLRQSAGEGVRAGRP